MKNIITTTNLQQKIGQISASIEETAYIVTNHGQGKAVLLPYFDGCDENIDDYLENFEMWKNRAKLKKHYEKSKKSGRSSLVI